MFVCLFRSFEALAQVVALPSFRVFTPKCLPASLYSLRGAALPVRLFSSLRSPPQLRLTLKVNLHLELDCVRRIQSALTETALRLFLLDLPRSRSGLNRALYQTRFISYDLFLRRRATRHSHSAVVDPPSRSFSSFMNYGCLAVSPGSLFAAGRAYIGIH